MHVRHRANTLATQWSPARVRTRECVCSHVCTRARAHMCVCACGRACAHARACVLGGFDVILGADLIYSAPQLSVLPALLATVQALLGPSPDARFCLAVPTCLTGCSVLAF